MILHKDNNQGFALLMSIIIVGVVISIGLTVLDLTLKQLRLSTNSKDSETAFHAANAGLECARYYREEERESIEDGDDDIAMNCFGVSMTANRTGITVANGEAHLYSTEATWGSGSTQRCSQIKTLIFVSETTATTTINNMQNWIPCYPYGDRKDCEPGGRCAVISSQGYSRSCSNLSLPGTVQREVLLEL